MISNLTLINLAGKLAEHAEKRHAMIARNIANADTPGYFGADIGRFSDRVTQAGSFSLNATRPGHIAGGQENGFPTSAHAASAPAGPVQLEVETARMAENRQDFELAMAVYKSSIGILRTSLGSGR